jgi:hypothetical protein
MAIPLKAIKKVERVDFELPFSKKDKEKYFSCMNNMFEIFLKDDFLELYLKPDYELKVGGHCSSHGHNHNHTNSSHIQ